MLHTLNSTLVLVIFTLFRPARLFEPKIDFGYNISLGLHPAGALELELQHQHIPVLKTGSLQNLPNFYKLKLEYDGIEEVQPSAFVNLTSLSRVSLQANRIKEIPAGIFNKSEINTLYLGNNSISHIAAAAFDDMANLRIIQLNNNSLKGWNPRWFKNSPNVQFVLFQFNQILELPAKAFWNIRRSDYVYIDLSHNFIDCIDPRAFQGLGTLEVLHLEHNNLRRLHDLLFVHSRKLEYLTLNDNLLECLSGEFLGTLVRRIDLQIRNNAPMSCECLSRVATWAKVQNPQSDTANKVSDEIKKKCN